MSEFIDDWISLQETFKLVIHSGIRLVFTPNSFTSRFHFQSFSIFFQSANKMPAYQVQIDEFRQQMYFLLNTASNEVFILGQSLETDWYCWKLCDSRNFIPYATYLVGIAIKPQSDEWIFGGCKFRRSLTHVSSERKYSARLPNADCGWCCKLAVCNKATICSLPTLSERSSTKLRAWTTRKTSGVHLLGSEC